MRKIKTKLMIGIGIVFLISYSIMMVNMGTNQSIVSKSDSLLTSNYFSLKHTFQMFRLLNDVNVLVAKGLSKDSVPGETLRIIERLERFEQPLKLQTENITEPGELQLNKNLQKSFDAFRHYLVAREQPFYWPEYNKLFQEVRNDILELYQINAESLEAKNDDIKEHSEDILNLQKTVGIIGLALLCVLLIFLPLYLLRPIDHLTWKLKEVYEQAFKKEVNLKKGHEMQQLEEMVEKIVAEVKKVKEKNDKL
jgi:two-component system, NtrC family, sensor histidine kinase KinB